MADFSEQELERYSRQIIMPEIDVAGQEALRKSKVLVVGAGGLGSPCLLYLAAAGLGHLGIIDFDVVDRSNLGRQILHTELDVGRKKTDSAREKLQRLNPDISYQFYEEKLTPSNFSDRVPGYDFVVDGSDNFLTKYLINDECYKLGIPFNIAGILKFEGQMTTVVPPESACFRCLFPEPPPADSIPTCSTAGVLGPVAGILGAFQAAEALKFCAKKGKLLTNKYLTIDLFNLEFKSINFGKNTYCPVCGSTPRPATPITEDYCHDH